MKKTICFIILLALTVICAAGAAADDAPANLVLQTSQSQLAAGDTLTVTMNIKAVKPVGRVTASVSYDSSVLKFVSGSGAKDAGGVIQIEQLNGLDTSATITLTFTAAISVLQAALFTMLLTSSTSLRARLQRSALQMRPRLRSSRHSRLRPRLRLMPTVYPRRAF